MPLWGSSDANSNSPFYAVEQFRLGANVANRNALYGNTTPDAFTPGETVGVFAADSTELGVGSGGVIGYTITFPGSGYSANAAVTLTGGGGTGASANATANSIGRVSAVNANQVGSSFETSPDVAIAAPSAKTFNANTGVAANGFITITGAGVFQVGDKLTYLVAAGNTAIAELANNTQYWVQAGNSTGVYLAATLGGAALTLTPSATSETGHSLTGETATAAAIVSGAQNKGVAHQGWQIRRVGSGGRAGRVQYETLVTAHIGDDGSDDTILPDS